ncbi:MAG: clostripain-related cysteine peptidase [Eubacteriaceae bacterium]|nr:clostripain-related cysteine peptidase [Eubacteriaceae bacterium]
MRNRRSNDYPQPKKKKKPLRRILFWALIIFILFTLYTVFEDDEIFTGGNDDLMGKLFDEGDSWVVYWYLCGTDLESKGNFASTDLEELCKVTLPDNVSVVIETGGAFSWKDSRIDPNMQCRFLYSNNTLELVEKLPKANMSDPATLASFLNFCNGNYPADHIALVMWDHGGGSVGGIIYDEVYNTPSMSLVNLRKALEMAFTPSKDNPPLELIGFDACLMATVETAAMCQDIARYMVASEELEPACGWNYEGFLGALAEEPRLNGAMLGKAICDSYAQGANLVMQAGEITLSCVNLMRLDTLLAAWHNVGVEALASACENPAFFSEYARSAEAAEKYGPNEKSRGFTGMIDIGDMVMGASGILPETAASIESTLAECVVYKINGPYRMRNTGLSFYYPLDMGKNGIAAYSTVSVSKAHDYLYEFLVDGQLSWDGAQYARSMSYVDIPNQQKPEAPEVPQFTEASLPEIASITGLGLEDYPVSYDRDMNATLNLGSEVASQLAGVYFNLAFYDEVDDCIFMLGRDNDLDADWENGVFKDNFWAQWGAIDGAVAYMDLVFESDVYDAYSVPILLNGEEYSLAVVYVYATEQFEILGARSSLGENGLASKEIVPIYPGDEITTILYVIDLLDEEITLYKSEVATITVNANTRFQYEDLWDGEFLFFFEMVDAQDESRYSEMVTFTVEGGALFVDTD